MSETCVVNKRTEPYDVYIGRPSKWGNPFVVGKDGDRAEVIAKYGEWIMRGGDPALVSQGRHLLEELEELRGKRLGCWCAPLPCHGDVLVELLEGRPPLPRRAHDTGGETHGKDGQA